MVDLDDEDRAVLDGERGEGARLAMELVVSLAEVYGAERLVPVKSAQVAGVSYKNLGDAGLELLEAWADAGARCVVPATLNPAGADLEAWERLGLDPEFVLRQRRVVDAYARMGVEPSCTCTPYLAGNLPRRGDHLAWAESSAVAFANSVLGARTNREGGPSSLAAAIVGKTAHFGLHEDANRAPTLLVEVAAPPRTQVEWGALGRLVGRARGENVPLFAMPGPRAWNSVETRPTWDQLKSMGAALATHGSVALFHVLGVTPEASDPSVVSAWPLGDLPRLEVAEGDLDRSLAEASDGVVKPDLVAVGCPHASLSELGALASLLSPTTRSRGGKKLAIPLWAFTSRKVLREAEGSGLAGAIRGAGAELVADTCVVVAPLEQLGVRSLVTNSAKAAHYCQSSGMRVGLVDLDECVRVAVTGRLEVATSVVAKGRVLVRGVAEGPALVTRQPISFLGGVDPDTGRVVEPRHELFGEVVTGKVLVFPGGKGSTVGSYTIYRMAKQGTAPAALVAREAEAIVAAGATLAGIPLVDRIERDPTTWIRTGSRVRVENGTVRIIGDEEDEGG